MRKDKLRSIAELEPTLAELRREGKRIALCHGVWDLMHPGHILHFRAAREHGDVLVVTVTPDRFVNKGPGRPVFNQRLRAETLAALELVDFVAINEWPTAVETIQRLRPSAYVKGSEYENPQNDLTGKIVDEQIAVESVGGKIVFTHEETFSSSSLINLHFRNMPTRVDDYLRAFRERHAPKEIVRALDGLQDVRVLLIGEAILDQYCYSIPLGKVPKETIIASKYVSEEDFAGGSLAVANHLGGFCRDVTLVTCLGPNAAQRDFIRTKLRPNVRLRAVSAPHRPTIVKRRYVEPAFLTKLFEIQYLDDTPLPAEAEAEVRAILEEELAQHDMIVVADFGHGLMTERLREVLCASEKFLAVNTQTNSANVGFNSATKYRRADYVCLHEGELKLSLRAQHGDIQELAARLRAEVKAKSLTVTRGPNGSLMLTADGGVCETPALSLRIVDRVGAGDAYFAVTSLCRFKELAPDVVGFIGNCVGALAVEIVCNREPVDPAALRKFVNHLLV